MKNVSSCDNFEMNMPKELNKMCGMPPFCALIGIYVISGKPTQNITNNSTDNNHGQYNCNGNDVDSQSFIQRCLKYYLILFPPSLKTPTQLVSLE